MSTPTVRFGLVGCGRVSRHHLDAICSGAFPIALAAVCDTDAGKAAARGEEYGVPHYADAHEMLERHPEIDVVDVATPTGMHAAHVIDLARHGRHIVVEKPMALRVEDCAAMNAAVADAGARLFVVKQNRFNPAVVAARHALESGRLGKLVLGSVRVRWRRDQAYYDADDWHGTWALDGGVMAQQASHHLDLLQWFFGPVVSVRCQTATRLLDIEVEDTSTALLRFESGALGIFEATVATRPADLEASFSILGEGGSIVIGGRAVNRLDTWRFEDETPDDAEVPARASAEVPTVYGHGHGPYLAHVAKAILTGDPALVDGDEGAKNVEILTALYESAACDGEAKVPGCPARTTPLGRPPGRTRGARKAGGARGVRDGRGARPKETGRDARADEPRPARAAKRKPSAAGRSAAG